MNSLEMSLHNWVVCPKHYANIKKKQAWSGKMAQKVSLAPMMSQVQFLPEDEGENWLPKDDLHMHTLRLCLPPHTIHHTQMQIIKTF